MCGQSDFLCKLYVFFFCLCCFHSSLYVTISIFVCVVSTQLIFEFQLFSPPLVMFTFKSTPDIQDANSIVVHPPLTLPADDVDERNSLKLRLDCNPSVTGLFKENDFALFERPIPFSPHRASAEFLFSPHSC